MITIRKIKKSDVPTVAGFEREIAIISFGKEAIRDQEFHQRKIEKAFPKEKAGMFVLEVDGEVVGWLWMTVKQNYLTHEKYASFKSLYVTKEYRGTEYVKALMDAGMGFCKKEGVKKVIGKTHTKNLPMQILYKNYGFRPTHLTMEYVMKE